MGRDELKLTFQWSLTTLLMKASFSYDNLAAMRDNDG